MADQPFINDILHTGPSSATFPDVDFSWNAGPPSAGLTSPLISPTAHFDAYFAADQAISLETRASVASETNNEELLGQPRVSRLVQADLYVVLPPPPLSPLKKNSVVCESFLNAAFSWFPWLISMIRALRDQFYWDRVHVFVPIIHQRRYRTWSRHPDKSEAQKCLQSTMWALAASASTGHHQNIRDSLCKQLPSPACAPTTLLGCRLRDKLQA